MKTRSGILLSAVVVLLAALLFLPVRTAGQEGPGQGPVVFFNLKKAIDSYGKTKTLEDQIEEVRGARAAEIQTRKDQLNTLGQEIKLLDPASSAYFKTWREMEKEKAMVQYEEEALKRELQVLLLKATKDIYQDIASVCDRIRKDRGYLAILKIEGSEIQSESKAELILKINSRAVISADPAYDITDDVIRELNGAEKKD